MVVDYSHRNRTANNNIDNYHRAVSCFNTLCTNEPMILASMVIGSYAKKEIVPGWSDLDFIVVFEHGYSSYDYRKLFLKVESISEEFGIPLGIDYCFQEEINQVTGIQGRALSMALEVANYGEQIKGIINLPRPPLSTAQITFLEEERIVITGTELLSWRRISSRVVLGEIKDIYFTTKSLLRLLMYESEPIMFGAVNIQAWLTSVSKIDRLCGCINAFSQAAETRTRWAEVITGKWRPPFEEMETALLQYKIK
jgi:predicted nucleotidyltransferase